MNRKPLLNCEDKDLPNIGTVVFLDSHDYSPSKCSIGYWRGTHPSHRVGLVYGVKGVCSKGRLTGMGHGMFLAVSSPDLTRYYSHGAGNVEVDDLLMPMQVIRDWDEFIQPLPRQLHWADLKWFEPSYSASPRTEKYTREELGAEIKRRLDSMEM